MSADRPEVPLPAPVVKIRCRVNGPLVVDGPVVIVDHLGNPLPVPGNKGNVALCRCGASANKPFCDGSHRDRFQSEPPTHVSDPQGS